MAFGTEELYSSTTKNPFPRINATSVKVKEFAAFTGGKTLSVGHPVAFNTSTNKWVPLDGDGTNGTDTIQGFVYPDAITLLDSNEKLGQVMLAGDLHYDDVNGLGVGGSEIDATQAQLDAALREDCRKVGIHVDGLTEVR